MRQAGFDIGPAGQSGKYLLPHIPIEVKDQVADAVGIFIRAFPYFLFTQLIEAFFNSRHGLVKKPPPDLGDEQVAEKGGEDRVFYRSGFHDGFVYRLIPAFAEATAGKKLMPKAYLTAFVYW